MCKSVSSLGGASALDHCSLQKTAMHQLGTARLVWGRVHPPVTPTCLWSSLRDHA